MPSNDTTTLQSSHRHTGTAGHLTRELERAPLLDSRVSLELLQVVCMLYSNDVLLVEWSVNGAACMYYKETHQKVWQQPLAVPSTNP